MNTNIDPGNPPRDFGDAPTVAQSGLASSYPTQGVDSGASHALGSGLRLGGLLDADRDGQPTPSADGEVEDHRIAILDGDGSANVAINMPAGESEVATDGQDLVVRHSGRIVFRAPRGTLSGGTFSGTNGDETLGLGTLTGGSPNPISLSYNGRDGSDQLKLLGSGQTLDLINTIQHQLASLEVIDVVGSSPNVLSLTAQIVLAITDADRILLVRHDQDDTVHYGLGWQVVMPQLIDSQYRHILRQAGAEVRVANTLAWQNPYINLDVSRDGSVVPVDVLNIVNTLNASQARALTTPTTETELVSFYYDTNGDRFVTPQDALVVINFLNRQSGQPEGETGDWPVKQMLLAGARPALPQLGVADPRVFGLDAGPDAVVGAPHYARHNLRIGPDHTKNFRRLTSVQQATGLRVETRRSKPVLDVPDLDWMVFLELDAILQDLATDVASAAG